MNNMAFYAACGGIALGIIALVSAMLGRTKQVVLAPLPKLPTPEAEKAIKSAETKIEKQKDEDLHIFVGEVRKDNNEARKNGLGDVAGILRDTDKKLRAGK